MLTLYDFHGFRILPGRETAEPTWPRAALWLMGSHSPTTTDLRVGRLELDSGWGTNSPPPFSTPAQKCKGILRRHPVMIRLNFPSPMAQWVSLLPPMVPRCILPGVGCGEGPAPAPTIPSSGSVEEALREASVQILARNTRAGNWLSTPSPLFLGR